MPLNVVCRIHLSALVTGTMVLKEIGILLLDKFLGLISYAERSWSEVQTWTHGVPGAWRCIVIITVENLAFGRERCECLAIGIGMIC